MSDFFVTESAMRPASSERRCFYCHEPVGGTHRDDCVVVLRRVRVRMVVEYEVDAPASWGAHEVEFHRNESSWCQSNAIDELEELFGDESDTCMCGEAQFTFVRATSEPFVKEGCA